MTEPNNGLGATRALDDRFGFDESDLISNRNGKLSQTQVEQIRASARRPALVIAAFAILPSALVGWGAAAEEGAVFGLVVAAVGMAVIGVPLGLIWWMRYPALARKGVNKAVRGPLKVFRTGHKLSVGVGTGRRARNFAIRPEDLVLFRDGEDYALHYTMRLGGTRVHSIERIPSS